MKILSEDIIIHEEHHLPNMLLQKGISITLRRIFKIGLNFCLDFKSTQNQNCFENQDLSFSLTFQTWISCQNVSFSSHLVIYFFLQNTHDALCPLPLLPFQPQSILATWARLKWKPSINPIVLHDADVKCWPRWCCLRLQRMDPQRAFGSRSRSISLVVGLRVLHVGPGSH